MTAGVLELVTADGRALDRITLTGGEVGYATGAARPILESVAAHLDMVGMGELFTVRFLDEWTDGTLILEAHDPDAPPAPETPMTLAEAGDAHDLKSYWVSGKGALRIRWKTPGDFRRCVRLVRKHVSDPEGLCNTYHQAAVGAPPGKGH